MVQMEFFKVDIFWSTTNISRNVELSQAALDWYAENVPLLSIVQAGQFDELPADIPPGSGIRIPPRTADRVPAGQRGRADHGRVGKDQRAGARLD